MKTRFKLSMAAVALALGTPAAAEVVFYAREGFQGRTFSTTRQVANFANQGFNDRASSVVVYGNRWEVCEDARFSGRCVVLRPGRYPSLAAMGLNNQVSSVRIVGRNARVEDNRFAPPPVPVYDSRRRGNERLFEANVTSVRAVIGRPEQRCWVEREQVAQGGGSGNSVAGAIVGGLLGGVLGHQVGSGRGNDLATAVGAIGGAAVGSNVARNNRGQPVYTQDVRRCENVQGSATPEYYDVTYVFRNKEHRIQTAVPPGSTVTVNNKGEPRG